MQGLQQAAALGSLTVAVVSQGPGTRVDQLLRAAVTGGQALPVGPRADGGSPEESPGSASLWQDQHGGLCGGSSQGSRASCSSCRLIAISPDLFHSQKNWKWNRPRSPAFPGFWPAHLIPEWTM
ncbi:hypothetical protein llap_16724 [Limosa lapponica baueri]|uniref:Uncharacterized protein n=1 Tax=Limosa lapponica baueri TaxID=1758121 RepID=A0A2I0TGV8_LIMLA|nr:hypothetical protein llap_16724 [Limosa lapponica baueri]